MGFKWDIKSRIGTHTADLDAHTRNERELYRVGDRLYPPTYYLYSAITTGTLTVDKLYAMPFPIARDVSIDRIAVEIITAGAEGAKMRLGIYKDGTNLYPGDLLDDYGTVDVDDTGLKAVTISPAQSLVKGLYWLFFIVDTTSVAIQRTTYAPGFLGSTGSHTNWGRNGWNKAVTHAAPPAELVNPFPADGSTETEGWLIALRFSSLD